MLANLFFMGVLLDIPYFISFLETLEFMSALFIINFELKFIIKSSNIICLSKSYLFELGGLGNTILILFMSTSSTFTFIL